MGMRELVDFQLGLEENNDTVITTRSFIAQRRGTVIRFMELSSVLHTLRAFPVEIGSGDFLIHSHASMQPQPNLYGLDVLFNRACYPRRVDLTRLVLQDV